MSKILETERLILREFNLEDAPFIIELLNSPGWLRFIGDRGVHTRESAEKYLLNGPIKSHNENGFGLYLTEEKGSGKPVGMCGLILRNYLETIDIGFAFLESYTGKGYGSEIASATLDYAHHQLGFKKVLAITTEDNQASIRLLEKLGMRFDKIIRIPNDPESLRLYFTP